MSGALTAPKCRRVAATVAMALALTMAASVNAASAGTSGAAPPPAASAAAGKGLAQAVSESSFTFGRFGAVAVYAPVGPPRQVVLFVSGDGGWNLGVVDMARGLASRGALVAGVDITRLLRALDGSADTCAYPAADFEALSQYLQKRLGLHDYLPPVLVGYSSGATLVYAVLAQAPPNTFAAAVSLGFCPDLALGKPLCAGHGLKALTRAKGRPRPPGQDLMPATALANPWIALQGTIDQVCAAADVQAYVRQVRGGELVLLPDVGHGFSVPGRWRPQFDAVFERLASANAMPAAPRAGDRLADLPLVEVAARAPAGDTLAVIVSGAGGWASLDRDLGDELARRGVAVVGLNALRYFWTARRPEEMARDLERILEHYLQTLGKRRAVLVGYSLGAEVLPFMTTRLPPPLLARVDSMVLIGPGERASFEFHLTDWLGGLSTKNSLPVRPEVKKLHGMRIVCIRGTDETDSPCRGSGAAEPWKTVVLPGGHHFGGHYRALADHVIPGTAAAPGAGGDRR